MSNDPDDDLDGYDGPFGCTCGSWARGGRDINCPVHAAQNRQVLGIPPPLENDRVAMMLGLVPDKRTPEERLWDAIRTNGESLKYHYEEDNT